MALRDLKQKQVLVTGAASGIGRATALAFAKRGARIIACDVNPSGLEAVKRDVLDLGSSASTFVVDVSSESAMRAFSEAVHSEIGAVDVLVNNAGIGHLGAFLDCDLAHWQRVLGINLMGVVHGCHFFLPKMIGAGGARRVINVSSMGGIYPSPNLAAYCVSKGAVWSFSEVLKMELLGTEVKVITVCPGVINTSIVDTDRAKASPKVTDEQLALMQERFRKQGCSPVVVGEAMVRAVQKGEDMVLTGPHARFVHHARRISIGLVRKMMLGAS